MNAMLNADLSNMPVSPRGLVGYWTSQYRGVAPGGTMMDLSVSGNDATMVGNAYCDSAGIVLDGSSCATTGFDGTQFSALTFSLWVAFNAVGAGSPLMMVVDNSPGSAGFMVRKESGSAIFLAYGYYQGIGLKGVGITIPDTEMHHCAFVYTTTNMYKYIDGRYAGAQTGWSPTWLTTPASAMRIGCSLEGSDYMNGRVDDVMVFSRVLSAAEIRALYDSQKWRHR